MQTLCLTHTFGVLFFLVVQNSRGADSRPQLSLAYPLSSTSTVASSLGFATTALGERFTQASSTALSF